jgi:hypothetical protein
MHLGPVEVCQQVTGYQRRDAFTGDVLANVDLDLPPSRLSTRAVWWTLTPATLAMAGLEAGRWPGTLHAVEHAAIGMLPLFTICDRWDVGGVSTALQADTGLPTIVIYDGYPGGAGIAELGYASGATAAGRHPRPDPCLPVHERVPVVRPVAEVREPQRAARQGGRRVAAGGAAGGRRHRRRGAATALAS